MPEPNPNQDFTDRLMGNPLFRAGAALTGELPQLLGQQQRGQTERDRTELLRQQLERQNSLADLQIFQGTVESIPKFQRFLQMIPDEKTRAEAAAEYGVFFSKLLNRVGRADKEAVQFSTPSAIASALLSSKPADQLVGSLEFLSPQERQFLLPLFSSGTVQDASAAWELAGKMNEKSQERILTGLGNRLATAPRTGPMTADAALDLVQATPQERKVVAGLPNRLDPEKLAGLYRSYGIIPPSAAVKTAEKKEEIEGLTDVEAKKAGAVERAKDKTLQRIYGEEYTRTKAKLDAEVDVPLPAKPTDEDRVRQEFLQQSKTFQITRDAFSRMVETSKKGVAALTPQDDIVLIINFMKVQDPESVVREGEFWTVEKTRGWNDTIALMWKKATAGDKLTPEQRSHLIEGTRESFRATARFHEGRETQYRDLAKKRNMDPGSIAPDLLGEFRKEKDSPKGAMPKATRSK